jgi:tRNA A-37 threonylcarbamoyl transferase component Bud32
LIGRRSPAVRWLALAGPPPDAIARALVGEPGAAAKLEPLAQPASGRGGRSALRAVLDSGEVLFVKRFPARPPRRRLQLAIARLVRQHPAHREWRALRRLAAAGAPVPAPRALGRLRGGDLVLVTAFLAGPSLARALAAGARGSEIATAVGSTVARLHRAGFVHGDLHAGNVVVADAGPLLVDLGAARRTRSRRARRRDAAALDHSVARSLDLVDRVRLRAAALGLHRPFDAGARRELRAVGAVARARGIAHARARMRRVGRPGRRAAPARVGALSGLRDRALAPEDLARALAAPPAAGDARRRVRFVEVGGRRLVVKEFATGVRGAIFDRLRGSPARRAWRAGFGLAALGVPAASPLAFLERRRAGLPVASALVLEDLCPAFAVDSPEPGASASERVDALARLVLSLHGAGAMHADLTAGNVLLARGPDGLAARLVDLEDARIPRRLGDAARARALAQLNASVPDWIPDALRGRAFRRYATWLPFRAPRERILARIVAASLARRHHWSGGRQAKRAASRRRAKGGPPPGTEARSEP